MDVRPGYRQTDVGVIPEEWDVRTIDQVAFVTSGKRLPLGSSLVDHPTPHPYIRVTDMRPGSVELSDIKYVPESVFPAIKRYRIYQSDIFISVAGSLGIVGTVPKELDGANLTENADRITNIECSQEYLLYVLMAPLVQNAIDSIRTVGAQPKLALTRIRKFKIPLPPTDAEQRAIAAALSDADALLHGLDRLIAKKRALKQTAMQQLLTGQTRLPGFREEWRPLNMTETSTLKARIGWQGLTTAEYLPTGTYYLVTGTDFADGKVQWSTCCFVSAERYAQDHYIQLNPRDILLTKDGTIGKVGYVDGLPGPATLNSGVFVIRPKSGKYDPRFFYYVLTSNIFHDFLHRLRAGSTISHLYQKDFVSFSFLAPSAVPEQAAIAAVLSEMDAELSALEARRDKTRALKQAMMQELLTGRTRLA
jgi:type I restriction enzyme S subunit